MKDNFLVIKNNFLNYQSISRSPQIEWLDFIRLCKQVGSYISWLSILPNPT